MGEPISPIPESHFWLAQVVGAALAIIGGFLAVIIRIRFERKQEIIFIKISLTDELHEVCAIIGKLRETYDKTHIVSNSYLNDLSKNTESFKYHRQRIFLVRNDQLRRDIAAFYKRLEENMEIISFRNKMAHRSFMYTLKEVINYNPSLQEISLGTLVGQKGIIVDKPLPLSRQIMDEWLIEIQVITTIFIYVLDEIKSKKQS